MSVEHEKQPAAEAAAELMARGPKAVGNTYATS